MLMVFIWFDFCTFPFDLCKSQIRPWRFSTLCLCNFGLWLRQDFFFVIKLRLFHQIAQILTYRENCMMATSFLVRTSSFNSIQFILILCFTNADHCEFELRKRNHIWCIYSYCVCGVACKNHDCSSGRIIYDVLINNNEYTHTQSHDKKQCVINPTVRTRITYSNDSFDFF